LFAPLILILGILLLASYQARAAKTLYFEDFQTYTTQNPAPNPLISGIPAGGQWYFVDPTPSSLAAGEHFTPTSSNIEGSRGWASSAANGRITNAISLATLRPGASHTFRLSFVAACGRPVGEACAFNYEISSSSGSLTFVSGRNLDNSQTFTSLSGSANANGGTVKSADRTFEFIFQAAGLTSADTINFSITRVAGVPTANANFLMDDVRLESQDDIPFAVDSAKGMLTLKNVRVFFTDDIGPEAATNAANYSLTAGASVLGVTLLNSSAVELSTTTLTPGAQYSLQVSGVTNLSGNIVSSATVNFTVPTIHVAKTLYLDDFESYPTQNPAPNPLIGSPVGGTWYFVDPAPPLAAGDHITTASGSITNSRGWASTTANARLTNAISLAKLRPGASHTFRLSFVAACVSTPVVNACMFDYEISSSSGSLTLVSGRNLDDSQTFRGLSGTGRAIGGVVKGLDRTFEFIFHAEGLTSADTINFSITRVIGAPVPAVTFLLDDVRLQLQDDVPFGVESVNGVLTGKHVRVSFTEDGIGPEAATNAANYSLSGGASVLGVTLLDFGTVELSTTPLTPGTQYSLQVSGVTNLSGSVVSSAPVSFTMPTDAPAIRYDAGNTTTLPAGPTNPTNLVCDGVFTFTGSDAAGMNAGPVTDDLGTGLNAWQIMDQNIATGSGVVNYNLTPSTGAIQYATTNAWRLTARIRYVDNFYNANPDQFVIFGDASVRRGAFGLGINADGYLFLNVLSGSSYPLPSLDPYAYHTYTVVFDPARGASYYVDDQLVAANQRPQAAAGLGLTFGASSTAGAGQANYNLVQLNVIGATQPVVTKQPSNTSGVVGQTATFTAGFSGWVNQYQWLSNGVAIPGAIGASYTTPALTPEFDGVQYSCRARHILGCVDTGSAVLKVFAQPPSVSLSLQGVNAKVSYFGILEYTTLMSPATWTPVATNTSGGSTYSVPVSGVPQQYFRARLP
jgi:hypothetical protein